MIINPGDYPKLDELYEQYDEQVAEMNDAYEWYIMASEIGDRVAMDKHGQRYANAKAKAERLWQKIDTLKHIIRQIAES